MWTCMCFKRPFLLQLVAVACLWSVVFAQSAPEMPPSGSSKSNGSSECPRKWWTTMWGFVVTLIILTMDIWGFINSAYPNPLLRIFGTVIVGALNPVLVLWLMLEYALKGMIMARKLRNTGIDVVAPQYPWSKSTIKLIMGSSLVVVNLTPTVHKEVSNSSAFEDDKSAKDLSEALVIGNNVDRADQYNVKLSDKGMEALLRSNVLPPYDQLKIIRGNSTWAMAISAAQATGYIYGIVVRRVQGLHVSPIEALACLLNIVVLTKAILHNACTLGHRPVLLYLVPEQEAIFIGECEKLKNTRYTRNVDIYTICGIVVGSLCLLGVMTYFLISFTKSLNLICVVPIIIFQVTLVLVGIGSSYVVFLRGHSRIEIVATLIALSTLIALLNLVAYVFGIVVTLKYWKTKEFDVPSIQYLSHILPYIG